MYFILMFSNSNQQTKRWADYNDDELLPVIPWAPHVIAVTIKYDKYEKSEWTTVKSKKKRKN